MSSEIELRFLVPASARAAVHAELGRSAAALRRETLQAEYLDTPDRRLARAGIAWRVRREGRRWIQTLKVAGSNALERLEHEAIRPDGGHDAELHAGTEAGHRLLEILARARRQGLEPELRCRTEVKRSTRRIRTRSSVVEVSFDEGRLIAGEHVLRLRELEFELISGRTADLLTLADRWRTRFGLLLEPRSKSERGDRLAEGSPYPALRKSAQPVYAADAEANVAFAAVLDECLAHVVRNAAGLTEGDPALRVEHVHQLRVAIRRLRSALRVFEDWVPVPPEALVAHLRTLFATLGRARDSDVLGGGVAAALAAAGAPVLQPGTGGAAIDPCDTLREAASQHLLLTWLAWRASLDEPAPDLAPAPEALPTGEPALPLARAAARRLRRWHGRIAADAKGFDGLAEDAIHALRKRVKRQRYAIEFFAPLLDRRATARYVKSLAALQERLGELNDLFVARGHYQALVAQDPAAWFALGWLAARIAEAHASVGPTLRELARLASPVARD